MTRLPKPATIAAVAVLIVIAAAWRLLPTATKANTAAPVAVPVRAIAVGIQNVLYQTNGVVTVRSLP